MTEKPLTPIRRAMSLMPWLDHHGASDIAKHTAQQFGWATLGEAWDQCPNVDCLLWGLARANYSDESSLRLFACRCVRETPILGGGGVVGGLVIHSCSRTAIEVAERFGHGQASAEEMEATRQAVWPVIENATGAMAWAVQAVVCAALAESWAAASSAAWAAQLTAGEVACEALWAATKLPAEKMTEAVWAETQAAAGAARTAAAKFQVNLLRQMIDPFRA